MGVLDYSVIGIYLLFMIYIGVRSAKKIKNSSDFALGGRTLSPVIITLSYIATVSGAGTCIAYAGRAYTDGFSALWLVILWAIGMFVLCFMAERIYNTGADSVAGVFGSIHGVMVERFAALFALMYCVGTLVSQMIGMGLVIQLMFFDLNLNYEFAVVVGGIITILYTLQGGFFAVAYTDAVQMIILGFAMVIVFPLTVANGAADASIELVTSVLTPGTFNLFEGVTVAALLAMLCKYTFSACTGIPYIQRLLACRNAKDAKNTQIFSSIGFLIVGSIIMIVAVFARILFPDLDQPDTIALMVMVNHFPTILAGLGLAGLTAAVMSTIDSYLLVVSQLFSHNICRWAKPDLTEEQEFKMHRVSTLVVGLIALLIALRFDSMLSAFEAGSSIYSSAIFFPFVLSLYWKKTTSAGALCGMIAGGVVAIILVFFPLTVFDGVILGNLISLAGTVLVSLFYQPKSTLQKV